MFPPLIAASAFVFSAALASQPARQAPKAATPRAAASPPPPQAAAPSPAPVPFGSGERATYNIAWSSMTAGTATLSIGAVRNARGLEAWIARADATPSAALSALYTLKYSAESTFDARSLLPRLGLVDSLEGKRRRVRKMVFNHAGRKAQYSVTIGDTVSRSIDIASDSQDILSVLYKIRTLPLAGGFRTTIPVCDNGRCYGLNIAVGEKSALTTALGSIEAFKVVPSVAGETGGPQALWLSADDRRLLLRAESTLPVGRITIELATYAAGSQ